MEYFYLNQKDEQIGPVYFDHLKGNIRPDTLIWRKDLENWIEACQLKELASIFNTSASSPVKPESKTDNYDSQNSYDHSQA